jgi:predicted amidohydrolase YtcJ
VNDLLVSGARLLDGRLVDLSIARGRIEKIGPVGTSQPAAAELRADGRLLLPGFVDAHTHFLSWGVRRQRLSLAGVRGLAEVENLVASQLRDHPSSEPLIGFDWDESSLTEKRFLTLAELDRLAGRRAVILKRICGHTALASSGALSLIARRSGSKLPRNGMLTGRLPLIINQLFPPSPEQLQRGLELAMTCAHRLGITAIHELAGPSTWKVYQQARRQGRLRIRVSISLAETSPGPRPLRPAADLGLQSGLGDEWLRFAGIKLFADGSVGARTAALNRPYQDAPRRSGRLYLSPESLARSFAQAEEAGLQLCIHAIGDRAIDAVLKAAKVAGVPSASRLRHRIEHAELLTDARLERIRDQGLILSMQPNFAALWGSERSLYWQALGKQRWALMNRFRTIHDCGIPLAFGSDTMPPDPLLGLRGAIANPVPGEALSPKAAVLCYSGAAAHAAQFEDAAGEIAEHRRADLALLNCGSPARLADQGTKIVATLVEGKVVYQEGESGGEGG